MKRFNAITSLRSGCLIDHNLEDLVDVPIHLSPTLPLPSVLENGSTSRDAMDDTLLTLLLLAY